MSSLAIRRTAQRLRRHTTALLLVAGVAFAITLHHSGLATADGSQHHDAAGAAIEMCLGVLTVAGTVVAAVALGVIALRRWPTASPLPSSRAVDVLRTPAPLARAGPRRLARLCVWRR